ncbi:hypothetical protein EHZ19_15720 [Paraburkholderia bannensis]|jgi:hypothetical protein|nr:hypothetical protein [Paraburkholderia bannensis]RQM47101.1 hypothetical protein EHZ19_15720 [Paraburkholderia bannensis]
MSASNAELRMSLADEGRRINQDLVDQINAMVEGEHSNSECFASGKPILVEGVLWTIFGAILWVVTLYLAS